MNLFEAFLKLKNISFWDSNTAVFKAVCETRKLWFACVYIHIYIRKSSFFESSNSFQKTVFDIQKELFLRGPPAFCYLLFSSFLVTCYLLFTYFLVMNKSRNRLQHNKTQSKWSFFETQTTLRMNCCLSFKKAVFESVFECQESLFYIWFYQGLSDVTFFRTLTNC